MAIGLRHSRRAGLRTAPWSVVAGPALAGALLVLGACSSSSSAGGTTPSAGSSPAGSPADAATVKQVSAAYAALFGSSAPFAKAVASLQHGAAFAATIKRESKGSYAQTSAAKVSSVRLLSSDLAAVTFSISSGGQTMLPNSQGNAVKENGTWKVAARTFCGLLRLEGTAPKVCSDPKITALPK